MKIGGGVEDWMEGGVKDWRRGLPYVGIDGWIDGRGPHNRRERIVAMTRRRTPRPRQDKTRMAAASHAATGRWVAASSLVASDNRQAVGLRGAWHGSSFHLRLRVFRVGHCLLWRLSIEVHVYGAAWEGVEGVGRCRHAARRGGFPVGDVGRKAMETVARKMEKTASVVMNPNFTLAAQSFAGRKIDNVDLDFTACSGAVEAS
ncbi:hypothetical protein C8R44DRAFT_748407 [Mycena epipterygia]|nr:hypothetical protein C8R44DRAFT_748407 [Mycena epipterygia]